MTTRYAPEKLPVWIDFEGSFYGFPSFDGVGAKACPDWLGPIERPDDSAREVADETIEASRSLLRRRFPGLADQPVVRRWTCFYEVTPDANFVIDRHPTLDEYVDRRRRHGPRVQARPGHRPVPGRSGHG